MQEITQLLLLEVFLGEVLQVSLGERKLSSNNDLGLVTGDGDFGSEFTGFAVDLDSVVKELLERGRVEDLVLNWLPAVNGELGDGLLGSLLDGFL